jgi:hypothetical protein
MKTMTLRDRLAWARERSAELNARTDELNERLAEVDRLLADMHLGVHVGVEMGGGTLEFRKHGGEWCLLVRTASEDYVPVTKASRATRLAVVDALPLLVEALIDAVAEQTTEVSKRLSALGPIIELLKPEKSEEP